MHRGFKRVSFILFWYFLVVSFFVLLGPGPFCREFCSLAASQTAELILVTLLMFSFSRICLNCGKTSHDLLQATEANFLGAFFCVALPFWLQTAAVCCVEWL